MTDIDGTISLVKIRHPNFSKNYVFKIIDSSYEIDKNAINNLVVLTYLFKLKYPEFTKKKHSQNYKLIEMASFRLYIF